MCPASTAKMMGTQKQAKDAGVTQVEFVSITLDPTYDTPGVLKEYATTRGIDTGNFSFLTGPEAAVRDLLTQGGLASDEELKAIDKEIKAMRDVWKEAHDFVRGSEMSVAKLDAALSRFAALKAEGEGKNG